MGKSEKVMAVPGIIEASGTVEGENVGGAGMLTCKLIVAVSIEAKPFASVSLSLKDRLLPIDDKIYALCSPLYSIVSNPMLMERKSFSSTDINSNVDGAWVPSTMAGNAAIIVLVTPGVNDKLDDGTALANAGVIGV